MNGTRLSEFMMSVKGKLTSKRTINNTKQIVYLGYSINVVSVKRINKKEPVVPTHFCNTQKRQNFFVFLFKVLCWVEHSWPATTVSKWWKSGESPLYTVVHNLVKECALGDCGLFVRKRIFNRNSYIIIIIVVFCNSRLLWLVFRIYQCCCRL